MADGAAAFPPYGYNASIPAAALADARYVMDWSNCSDTERIEGNVLGQRLIDSSDTETTRMFSGLFVSDYIVIAKSVMLGSSVPGIRTTDFRNFHNDLSPSLLGLPQQSLKPHCTFLLAAATAGSSPAMTVKLRHECSWQSLNSRPQLVPAIASASSHPSNSRADT